jgi:hypothetical protein
MAEKVKKINIKKSNAGVKISFSNSFKAPKGEIGSIRSAIKKIGTGLGNEHQLHGKYKGCSTIKVGDTKRIRFQYSPNQKSAKIIDYDSTHCYR